MNSPLGISLYNRGGQKVFDRVLEVYTERYSLRPSLDYLGALEEIGRDLITDELPEPPKVEPPPAPVVKVTQTPQQKAAVEAALKKQQERDAKARQFAYMVNAQLNRDGVNSLKSRGGFVTVVANGTSYQYPYKEFESLWEDAARLGLLTVGGLR